MAMYLSSSVPGPYLIPFTHSLSKYLGSIYYMLTTIPGVDDATVNNQRIVLDLFEFVFLVKGFLLVRL